MEYEYTPEHIYSFSPNPPADYISDNAYYNIVRNRKEDRLELPFTPLKQRYHIIVKILENTIMSTVVYKKRKETLTIVCPFKIALKEYEVKQAIETLLKYLQKKRGQKIKPALLAVIWLLQKQYGFNKLLKCKAFYSDREMSINSLIKQAYRLISPFFS